jgi:hypothetical protein
VVSKYLLYAVCRVGVINSFEQADDNGKSGSEWPDGG